jgi:M6 family metalloprotease-like protein
LLELFKNRQIKLSHSEIILLCGFWRNIVLRIYIISLSSLKLTIRACLLIFCMVAQGWGSSEKILSVKKITQPQSIEKSFVNNQGKRFKSGVSQKNLLNLKRKHPYSLPILAKPHISHAETLKVLGIRVEFQEEDPDDPQTTGNGLFDMRSQEDFLQDEGHAIDPSPHDTLYFKKHLEALHNYWWTVSKGKLAIQGEIYPKSETLAYRLPHPMAYYGAPDSSLSGKVEMLRQFYHDSFNLADSLSRDGDSSIYRIDFESKKYDSFVIFHAGSDYQSDLGELVAPTPGDLFTGFIVLGDTIYVEGDIITEGLIMPETQSQDNRITAFNAVFAHEFGHQLGLVDLYNTRNFMTQVGDFALMDNNASDVGVDVGYGNYVSGVLPVYPCAWSKAYLGFITPEEIIDQDSIRLFASEMLRDDLQLIKIPINSEEYFLIENRQVDLDEDHMSGLLADSTTNVILGPVDSERNYNREYDWLLPGSGILIWHVDEGVAYLDYDGDGVNNFWDNDLQLDKDRRFLTIVEADGIIDFGGNYYTGYGQREDLFYWGNNTALTPHTFPSSKSRNKSNTHIWITNISRSDTVMSLDISKDWHQAGFPQKFVPEADASSLVYADVDNNGNMEIFASSGGFIHAWGPGGVGLIPNSDSVEITQFDYTPVRLPLAIFAEDDSAFFGPPSLGDLNGDDTLEVVAATVDGKVYAWHAYDLNQDGRADILDGFPVQFGERISMIPVIADFDTNKSDLEIFVGGENGKAKVISHQGSVGYQRDYQERLVGLALGDTLGTFFIQTEGNDKGNIRRDSFTNPPMPPLFAAEIPAINNSSPVSGDINRDGDLEVIVVGGEVLGGDSKLYVWDSFLNPLPGFPVEMSMNMVGANPVLGDLDKDGYLEIVVAYQYKIFAYNFNGTPVSNFPITVSHAGGPTDLIDSSPILGDVDGDGYPDIIVGTKNKQILAYNKVGKMVDGFPLSCGGTVTSSPIFLNLDVDDTLYYIGWHESYEYPEFLVASDDGFVYAWQAEFMGEFDSQNNPWTQFGYDAGHTNHFPKESLPPMPPVAGELLPENLAYNYPNPAKEQTKIRYYLREGAEVNIRIYDLSGMLVDEFSGPGEGQTANERIWDCSDIASGVYLCRVEARSSSESKVAFFKIAIVR